MIEFLAARSGGDARAAYNALELACETAQRLGGAVTIELAEDAMQKKAVLYDKGGDKHYDYISAWIKATRGSDVDASLYYLAVMLEGGEDPRFIARRMIVLASEDIGNADPQALQVAVAAAQAVEHVGMPECALNLSQAAVYLALAPKSNASYKAIARARADVREQGAADPAALPPGRALPGRAQAGPRRRLRVSARRCRRASPTSRCMPEGLEDRALLRADRARLRGDTAGAPRTPEAEAKRDVGPPCPRGLRAAPPDTPFPCLLAFALAALSSPPTAGATTYCVDKPSCAGVSKCLFGGCPRRGTRRRTRPRRDRADRRQPVAGWDITVR